MFPVEIVIGSGDEDALQEKMRIMREWLDHRRFEPSTFRYKFSSPGILVCVEFKVETEAAGFAKEFGGRALPATVDTRTG